MNGAAKKAQEIARIARWLDHLASVQQNLPRPTFNEQEREDLRQAARWLEYDTSCLENAATAPPERVRVMRLYVFEGPRDRVEQQILRSQADGTKQWGDLTFHAATIGSFPEILKPREYCDMCHRLKCPHGQCNCDGYTCAECDPATARAEGQPMPSTPIPNEEGSDR